jgi:hypothetical protein
MMPTVPCDLSLLTASKTRRTANNGPKKAIKPRNDGTSPPCVVNNLRKTLAPEVRINSFQICMTDEYDTEIAIK